MGEQFTVEAPGRRRPLASLPRGKRYDAEGSEQPTVVDIDVDFGRRAAGCCICDIAIPPETTRVMFRILLASPIVNPATGARRVTEKYYAHPGCLTERVRPEVIRTRMDCYDCGAIPDQPENSANSLIYYTLRCFTVSKFAAAPICGACARKPRWKQCDACLVYFPHWMVAASAVERESVPAVHMAQYMDLSIRENDNLCEFCAHRLGIPTIVETLEAKAAFDKLREEIAARGIFEAGED